jgi:hypothetical protein
MLPYNLGWRRVACWSWGGTEIMTTDEKSRGLRNDGNEPAGQRLPWHAPKLIKSTTIQRLTGTHARNSGGNVNSPTSSVS